MSLAQRLLEAADWLEEDLPPGTVAPEALEGDVRLDQLDAYCIEVMREAAAQLEYLAESRVGMEKML